MMYNTVISPCTGTGSNGAPSQAREKAKDTVGVGPW